MSPEESALFAKMIISNNRLSMALRYFIQCMKDVSYIEVCSSMANEASSTCNILASMASKVPAISEILITCSTCNRLWLKEDVLFWKDLSTTAAAEASKTVDECPECDVQLSNKLIERWTKRTKKIEGKEDEV